MAIKIVNDSISKNELRKIAENQFGELVKAVIDIEKEIMAIGGDLHADEEKLLLEEGSKQENLWGVNLHINKSDNGFVEFDSMINIRPNQDNTSREILSERIRKQVEEIVRNLLK